MATAGVFFQSDPPHGLVKRLILKKYLQAYIPIMLPISRPENKLRIVDGFAGTGLYREYGWAHELERYGSPLIALRVAIEHLLKLEFDPSKHVTVSDFDSALQGLRRTSVDPLTIDTENNTLSLIYIEADEYNYKTLFKNVMQTLHKYEPVPFIHPSLCFKNGKCTMFIDTDANKGPCESRIAVTLFCAEFRQLQAPLLPCFAFIDPFGFSNTPFYKVREFVGAGMEVFINLMTGYINRFISVKPEQVGELFGISAQEVSELMELRASLTETDKISQLVDNYQNRLKGHAGARFTVNFEMRGLKNARIYHLVFATDHVRGIEVMKEAMNRGTQEANVFSASDYMIIKKGKPICFKNEQRNEIVAEDIHREFSGQTTTISTVQRFILFDTLYVFRKTPLSILERAEKMQVVGPPDASRRANQYPDHTNWELKFKNYYAIEDELSQIRLS